MKSNRTLTALLATYSAILLLAVIIGITVIISKMSVDTPSAETLIETEYIYVWADTAEAPPKTDATTEKFIPRIVKEYEGRIGIFGEDGKLISDIDIYTKTLPEADQKLLKEGIKINSESELRALIEDYSS